MTVSTSTPRLRITQAYFLALLAASAVAGPAPRPELIELEFRLVAFLLVATACLGRIWCSTFLAGRKDAQLVTQGPYARCRHPLYALSFLGGLGLALATRSVVLTLLTAAVLAMLLARAARAEERSLAQRHGTDYVLYANRTARWLPARGKAVLADTLSEVHVTLYWKAFRDAGAFMLLYLLIETTRSLRVIGLLPTLLTLP
jgi:protein-S-isoprenylcysteine O-methyltransferase Ste14